MEFSVQSLGLRIEDLGFKSEGVGFVVKGWYPDARFEAVPSRARV